MGSSMANGPKDYSSNDTPGQQQGGLQAGDAVGKVPEQEKREELSILGAASRTTESVTPVYTLLDRIQDGESPIVEDDRMRKKKKRGKGQR